jgi:hypothetical protein
METTLELWAASLRDVKARMRPLFSQARVAASASLFLDGLLGPEPRKTGWMRAEAAGDPGPWRQQAILGRGRWDADALRDIVRDYALETLADADAVLVLDETGFLKKGAASCGVARQYTGSAGKITNCQIGVFAAYVSRHGHALIDRALYLPKAWTSDPARRSAGHGPPEIGFASKPQLGCRMIQRAMAAGVPFAPPVAERPAPSETDRRWRWWLVTPSTASARSRQRCARPARAMCSAWPQTSRSSPGLASQSSAAAPKPLRNGSNHRLGSTARPGMAPKDRGCMTGPISNWPISMRQNTARLKAAYGPAAC